MLLTERIFILNNPESSTGGNGGNSAAGQLLSDSGLGARTRRGVGNGEAGYGIAALRVQLNLKIFSGSAIRCNVAEKPVSLDFSADSDRQNASFKDLQDM